MNSYSTDEGSGHIYHTPEQLAWLITQVGPRRAEGYHYKRAIKFGMIQARYEMEKEILLAMCALALRVK